MREYDVLIIGGGPAGLSTALHLIQLDYSWSERMIVLEKENHSRPKLCAGGVTRIGLETLRDLGIQLPLPIPGVNIEEARMRYRKSEIIYRRKPAFVVYNRSEFDAFLCEVSRKHGVVLNEGEAAQEITLTERGMEVITTKGDYLAQVVIGADGSKGISRRYLSKLGSQSYAARLLEIVSAEEIENDPDSRKSADFDFTWIKNDLQGYTWRFPSLVNGEPHRNLGVYDSRLAARREKANLSQIMDQGAIDEFAPQVQVQGHPLISFNPARQISGTRFLAVGDVAGVDALYGEGIAPSLAYGNLAAGEINSAFVSRDFTFQDYKKHLLKSRLGRYLFLRWLLAWVNYRLGRYTIYMHLIWFAGKILNAFWRENEWFFPALGLQVDDNGKQLRKAQDKHQEF